MVPSGAGHRSDTASASASLVPDSLDAAIELAVSDEVAVQRLAIRGRTDDTAPAIRERLEAFERETKPLLARLDAEGLLISVDADRPRAAFPAEVGTPPVPAQSRSLREE